MTDRPVERVVASEPFAEGYGDIILRSTDGVDFHVYKGIVLVASPIFRDMFSLPDSPASNQYEGTKPIIDMQEASSVLDLLLRFCYPVDTPKLANKLIFQKVVAAAQKFEMTSLYGRIVESYITEQNAKNRDVAPLEQFALAHRFKLPSLAIDSARRCLEYSLNDLVGQARNADLTSLSASEYNRLFQYHRACGQVCKALVSYGDYSWAIRHISIDEYAFISCSCQADEDEEDKVEVYTGGELYQVPQRKWWFQHIARIREAIDAKGPMAVKKIDVHQAAIDVIASGCKNCREAAIEQLHDFSKALEEQAKYEQLKVKLDSF